MLCREIISEAGVQTADVDRAARAAINQHLPEIVANVQATAASGVGDYIPPEDEGLGDYNMAYYDRLSQWVETHQDTVAGTICTTLSGILTEVVYDIAVQRFGRNKAENNRYTVGLEARELSDDRLRHDTKGYLSSSKTLLRVFIDKRRIIDAILGVIQMDLFGEDPEDYRGQFLSVVIPTFTHEYAHFEQAMHGKDFGKSDLSYITVGSKRVKVGGKRRGKRGGFHRYQDKTADSYARYLGSMHEIDAFASSAAAELVDEITDRWNETPESFNSQINDFRRSLAGGLLMTTSYDRYHNRYLGALEQEWPGLKPEEMTKVWQRFVRLLYAKLGHYLRPMVGKALEYYAKRFDPRFIAKAATTNMPQMVAYLARVSARKLINDGNEWDTPEQIDKEIDRGYAGGYEIGIQTQAENFIRNYYFGDAPWDKETQMTQVIDAYRRMTKKYYALLTDREAK